MTQMPLSMHPCAPLLTLQPSSASTSCIPLGPTPFFSSPPFLSSLLSPLPPPRALWARITAASSGGLLAKEPQGGKEKKNTMKIEVMELWNCTIGERERRGEPQVSFNQSFLIGAIGWNRVVIFAEDVPVKRKEERSVHPQGLEIYVNGVTLLEMRGD